jgi:hypothetical protein
LGNSRCAVNNLNKINPHRLFIVQIEEKMRIVCGLCLAVQELHRSQVIHTSDNQHKSVYKTTFDRQETEYTGQPYEVILQLKAKTAKKKHAAELAPLPVGGLQFPKRPGAAAVANPVLEGSAPAEAACPIDADNVSEHKFSRDIFTPGALIAWIVQGCQVG